MQADSCQGLRCLISCLIHLPLLKRNCVPCLAAWTSFKKQRGEAITYLWKWFGILDFNSVRQLGLFDWYCGLFFFSPISITPKAVRFCLPPLTVICLECKFFGRRMLTFIAWLSRSLILCECQIWLCHKYNAKVDTASLLPSIHES